MTETVIVNISPAGEVKIDVQGGRGQSCSDLTRELEKALGRTTRDVKKPEFLQSANQGAKHVQR